jgi:hypothetical protein
MENTMSTALTKCTTYTFYSGPGYEITRNINSTTTPTEFEEAWKTYPGESYTFDCGGGFEGGSAICIAAK